jgi:ribulose-phosphate 3-epimerase
MNQAVKISPSILTADFGHLAEVIRMLEEGGADAIHLDVMDGVFVPNISFGLPIVKAVRALTALPLDVHLMIEHADRFIDAFAEAGANTLTVHVEACRHLHRTIQMIGAAGCRAGVALNPATGLDTVRDVVPFVDLVLVMSVNPGYGGQRFIETTTNRIRRVRRMQQEMNPICDLQVDGGIYTHNIDDVVRAGANNIVVGSAVINGEGTPAENMRALREAIGAHTEIPYA